LIDEPPHPEGWTLARPARASLRGLAAEITQFLLAPMFPELAEEVILIATK
jgi:hypothetical protein